ncbi:MAG: hypothetical protein IPM35_34540 [Myxococcales bacterium]|nr:hypothetical protein [Myxococcales bacterium]
MSDRGPKGVNVFTVNSYGQSGGVTAGQVIYQGRPRRGLLGRQVELATLTKLKATAIEPVSITAWNPDAETQQFARHFWDLATQLGWPVKSLPNQTMCPDILYGISIRSRAAGVDVADPLRVLAEWLAGQGFDVEFVPAARENEIVVGPQA